MMKAVIGMMKVIGYFVLFLLLAILESIKYLFCGKNFIGRTVIASCYIVIAVSAVFNLNVLLAIIGIIVILDALFSIFTVLSSKKSESRRKGYSGSHNSNYDTRLSFFDGMTIEDAKREYRRLMKIYHPDNQNGDLSMSQRINNEYREYCATYAK